MASNGSNGGRQVVTCDDCGMPYTAVDGSDGLVLVGPEDARCPNCEGAEFSLISL